MKDLTDKSKYVLAAFDFDGTLTTKDTLFYFIKFAFGQAKFIIGMILFIPTFIKYKVGFINNSQAKEILFCYFFKGMSIDKFNDLGLRFNAEINKVINENTFKKFVWHKAEGHKTVIVSASFENWILPWAKAAGFEKVIATKAEVASGMLTGKYATENCNGPEKVKRLLQEFPERDQYVLHAYGDSAGDKELLDEADYPNFLGK